MRACVNKKKLSQISDSRIDSPYSHGYHRTDNRRWFIGFVQKQAGRLGKKKISQNGNARHAKGDS